jgi:hypothetical protein
VLVLTGRVGRVRPPYRRSTGFGRQTRRVGGCGSSVSGMEDATVDNVEELISCADCYAVVKKGDVDKHYEWHARAARD